MAVNGYGCLQPHPSIHAMPGRRGCMGGKGTIGNVEVMLVDALRLIEALREGVTMLQSPSSRSLHQ